MAALDLAEAAGSHSSADGQRFLAEAALFAPE